MALLQKIFLAFDQDDAQEFARLLMRIGTDQITSADGRHELDVVLEKERAAHKGLGFVLLPLLARSPHTSEKLETLKKTARLLHQFREVLNDNTSGEEEFLVPAELVHGALVGHPELVHDFLSWTFEQNPNFTLHSVLEAAPIDWDQENFLTSLMDLVPNTHFTYEYESLFKYACWHKNMDLMTAISKTNHFTTPMALEGLGACLSSDMTAQDVHFFKQMCNQGGLTVDVVLDAGQCLKEFQDKNGFPDKSAPAWLRKTFRSSERIHDAQAIAHGFLHYFLPLFAPLYQNMTPEQRVFSSRHDEFMEKVLFYCKQEKLQKSHPGFSDLIEHALLTRHMTREIIAAPDKKPKVF